MSKIKEVIIPIRIDGRWFDSQAIAEYKKSYHYQDNKKYFDVDKFDEDINVILYLHDLIMSGEIDLNEAEHDSEKIIRE
tara:strand:+ start:436 stop:672 length:237 start_codon:yes stop_codon:yes gene_type:complete